MTARTTRRWFLLAAGVLTLAVVVYGARARVERAYIAYRIYRAHVFFSPPVLASDGRASRLWADAQFYWDFAQIRIARDARLNVVNPSLKPLVHEIDRRQATGEGMQYSMHIYREIRWRLNFTADLPAIEARVEDLRQSLNEPENQRLAALQQPSDGSWGMGFTVWYLKLYYTVEDGLNETTDPQYPLRFLDAINSPEALTAALEAVLHDDFTKTGGFNREELDETFSAMARLLFRGERSNYPFDPQLGNALKAFVARWQNPATGCWGQWLVDRHGQIWKMDDMGITFHVVSDLNGHVAHLDTIAKRLLELEDAEFPAGLRFNGHDENHLNWDAVKIFRYAWPVLDEATRAKARASIGRMLDWCLTQSYQPDGSFKVSDLDDTVGDAYSYGVALLNETGYLRPANRFWTDQDFPDAKTVHDRIAAKLSSMGLNDPSLRDAYDALRNDR